MKKEYMRQVLSDSGCLESISHEILRRWEKGDKQDAIWLIKRDRCRLLDEMHDRGRKVDRLDLLVREAEKEMRQSEKEDGGKRAWR